MEFRRPKPKKNSIPKSRPMVSSVKNEKEIVGIFNGQFVSVHDWESMNYLYESGFFGKGTLSKGQPNYQIVKDDISKIMLRHQFENVNKWIAESNDSSQKYLRTINNDFKLSLQSVTDFLKASFHNNEQETWKSWKEKHGKNSETLKKSAVPLLDFKSDQHNYKDEALSSLVNEILQTKQVKKPTNIVSVAKEVIVLNTTFNSQATSSPLVNTNACLMNLPFPPQENLNLNLEESFFLKSVLGYLNIVDLNLSEIRIQDLWEKFKAVDKNFTERYIVYNYYRSKGWILRSGLKFGGDYLLYKDGPAHHHASYLVKALDNRKKLSWKEFIAMNRLVETFNKDLLLCQVRANETAVNTESYPSAVTNHSVQEILVRRWFPSKERFPQENDP